jgi:hypothetical protein
MQSISSRRMTTDGLRSTSENCMILWWMLGMALSFPLLQKTRVVQVRQRISVISSNNTDLNSWQGSLSGTAVTLTEPCEFDSCPTGSPAEGYNSSMPEFNYVNSFPVTAIEYGINTLAPNSFGGAPDLAVTGPNVGCKYFSYSE